MSQQIEIFDFLKNLLLGFLEVEEDFIQDGTTISSLSLESLDFVELQVEFEKKYRVKIRPVVFSSGQVRTVGEFVEHVQNLIAAPSIAKAG